MKLFDLHCDTLTELYRKKETLSYNTCHISLDRAKGFSPYRQVMAVWSDPAFTDDENYEICLATLDYAEALFAEAKGMTPILAVEGGKLLRQDLTRLDRLAAQGVKILTLVWKGRCCLGGAYDNGEGLTDFGRAVVRRCFELGITPDLSHASDAIAEETLLLAKENRVPVIASHSCARAVFPHPRNVSDEIAKEISRLGGVVGVNFVPEHLGDGKTETLVRHIEHLADVMGEEHVCLGGDFDGTSTLPDEIPQIGALPVLYDALAKKRRSEAFADAVFYTNAQKFAEERLFS